MSTLEQILAELDAEHPTLTEKVNGVESSLSEDARSATLARWAADMYAAQFPPVPTSITPRQMNLWLLYQDAGGGKTMLDKAIEYINAPTDNVERRAQQITWVKADRILRNDPLTISIGTLLGLSSAQIDQAFREASLL